MSERRGMTFERTARMKAEYAADDDVLDAVHAVEQLAAQVKDLQRQLAEATGQTEAAEERAWDVAAGHESIAKQATARAERAEAALHNAQVVARAEGKARAKAEIQVRDLQRQLAEVTGQTEAAKQAAREIMAERNTWARQLADMRDERDTARDEAERQRGLASEMSVDRDNLCVEIERIIEEWERSAARPLNNPMLDWQARHAAQLRRALARWLTT